MVDISENKSHTHMEQVYDDKALSLLDKLA